MLLKNIKTKFEEFAPLNTKEEWDNVGLMLGNEEADITKAYVCLDATEEAVACAIDSGCNLIVTHHPFIMPSIKNLDFKDSKSRMICNLIKNDINVYSMHTNFDSAIGGINDILCELLSLENYKVDNPCIFRKGTLKEKMTLADFVCSVKKILNVQNVICCGENYKIIRSVGICSGSGGSLIDEVLPCDAFLTGEAKYHEFQNAVSKDMAVVAAGHFETENIALFKIRDILRECKVEVYENEVFHGFSRIV